MIPLLKGFHKTRAKTDYVKPKSSMPELRSSALTAVPSLRIRTFTPPEKTNWEAIQNSIAQKRDNTWLLPWQRDLKGFKFLKIEPLCLLSDMGVLETDDYRLTACNNTIIATTGTAAIILDTRNRSTREIPYHTKSIPKDIHHTLSPDGEILIRWKWDSSHNSLQDSCTIEAIRTGDNSQVARFPGSLKCSRVDVYRATWFNNFVIYIPDSGQGIITRWAIGTNMASTSSMIRPLTDVGRHKDLRIYLEKEEKWWAVNGQTCNNQGTSATGLIQVYDVTKNESRVVPGIACCLAERDVYDRMTTLLFVCDASKGKLILRIQQLDPSLPGTAFEPVDVSVDMLSVNDCPSAIQVLDSLPIVAIMTTHSMLYFFEIHSGTYLFSRNFFKEQWRVWSNADNMNSFLFHRDNTSKIHRVSINTDDLIGYVRQVLKNDTLSSSIAIRTGLPGADDVLFNDMHAEYKNIAIDE